jgi:hypothetical protein
MGWIFEAACGGRKGLQKPVCGLRIQAGHYTFEAVSIQ